jgi:hypothetical protein
MIRLKTFSLREFKVSAAKTECVDSSPPTRPAAEGLLRGAESAERGSFLENPETRILKKASGLQPEKRDIFCLSVSPPVYNTGIFDRQTKELFPLRPQRLCGET